MKTANKLGFTLIELLVVITIIGILATGAVTVYTGQIQKARDTTRINDVKALESAIEQVYWDNSEYPYASKFAEDINVYMKKMPKDPKHASPCNNGWVTVNATDCAYAYTTSSDDNGIEYGDYEVSTAFENEWNVEKKAKVDGWWPTVELSRLEIWNDLTGNNTGVAAGWITQPSKWACTLAWARASAWTSLVVINWNPWTLSNQCD